jgi:serine protease Do
MKINFLKLSITSFMMVLMILPLTHELGGNKFNVLQDAHAISVKDSPVGTNAVVNIAKNLNPAVVNVSTKRRIQNVQHQRPGPDWGFPPFQDHNRPNNNGVPRGQPPVTPGGSGTGFVIGSNGYILTNHHVVANADEIRVKFQNDREYKATLIGSDQKTDIALIKIEEQDGTESFPHMTLGNSNLLEVGEWVVAIGNPFGLNHTVTVGIVSAMGRNIGSGPYDEFIQTDASINPGNSGGPLINMNGEVIGINTAIISGTGGNMGIGFAIPINMAKSILDDLKEKGEVTRGWLGITIQKLTTELANTFSLEKTNGALVNDVVPNSPADKGGIKRGDVIVKFGKVQIDKFEVLPRVVAKVAPGSTVDVEIIRKGKSKILTIYIEALQKEKLAFLDPRLNHGSD